MNSHQQIIKKINQYSISKTSFLLLVDFEMKSPVLYLMEDFEKEQIQFSFPHFSNSKTATTKKVELEKLPGDEKKYEHAFNQVMKHLKYGNSFLTNLTQKTAIQSAYSIEEIYESAHAKYKINFKNEWICFSPETFIQIHNNQIFSFPMKGTIDAAIENAAEILWNDEKEKAEHYTIVDLIRNDLSMVAVNIEVEKFRFVDTIYSNHKTLLQHSSRIKGDLPKGYQSQLGEILFSLLPAGSISGAPKTKTIEIIQEAESETRGYYTGVAFYFDGVSIDSCVLIRFIECVENNLFYRSGGGITINSEVEKEYQELLDKIYVPRI